ncbi:enoyl-ACP reductase FabV [Mariniplasma anaerobium]|uniref:trans-2-enoyl-CoA reductase (NAD(+)) n=1 Tax=Mariniplasma anaerobium TaxID=2735436 RepID=A0A7U9TJ00_9MOLU|nr:enoyl-ACP reductase FabV [Mariniplasma anaerobium]BCR36203.1 trans-2-enoyl-CoA reductase [NADH] [Mariniplasma anaerobium]
MLINPSLRSNFFTNAHPIGIKKNMENLIKEVKTYPSFKGPKNVLILGGSSGYGLASRISLAFGSNSNTINVSFERAARSNQSGSAGYWNNVFFRYFTKDSQQKHMDFNGDAYSLEMKQQVLAYVKENFGTLDLIIYSLASGRRNNPETGHIVNSYIKPLGKTAVGKTLDIANMEVVELSIEPASEQETKDTVYVMGGSDWKDWIDFFDQNEALSKNFKTISYTYIGGKNTDEIYRSGTLGKAKEDLELAAYQMNPILKEKYQGEALISSSKSVVSKAGVFIPQMPIYVACLFDVMKAHEVHETTLEHKYRLFKDMVYGHKRILDEKGRLRLDHREMQDEIQDETQKLMNSLDDQAILELNGTKEFLKEFYQINGFDMDGVDYEKDVDLDQLIKTYKPDNYIF